MIPDPEEAPIAGQDIVNCAWADESRTLCTNPACLRTAQRHKLGSMSDSFDWVDNLQPIEFPHDFANAAVF
jgi:hypothetical protein